MQCESPTPEDIELLTCGLKTGFSPLCYRASAALSCISTRL